MGIDKPPYLVPILVAVGRHLVIGFRTSDERLRVVESTATTWTKGTTLGISWTTEWVYL